MGAEHAGNKVRETQNKLDERERLRQMFDAKTKETE
jgi:hypothetical protein